MVGGAGSTFSGMNRQLMRENRQALAEDGAADWDQPIPVELEGRMEMRTKQRSEVKTRQDHRRCWCGGGGGLVTDNCCFSF